MLKKEMAKKLGDQVVFEFYSAYIYLAMGLKFDEIGLHGMAHWMRRQAAEEVTHGEGFMGYLREQGASWDPAKIEAPGKVGDSPKAIFEAALKHEKAVTVRLHEMAEAAEKFSDFVSVDFLTGYLKEQLEEEKQLEDILAKLAWGGEAAVVFVDCELGKRS